MSQLEMDDWASGISEAFSAKRILLTGGTGFFGKSLLSVFRNSNADVVVLSRNPDKFLKGNPVYKESTGLSFIQGDIRSFCFPEGMFDYVIHAATPVISDELDANSPEMYSIIVDGTSRVIAFSLQAGVKRILYVSSGAVYGVQPPEVSHLPESFSSNPVTVYGKGKLKAEQICLESGIDTVIARCFAFVGPWLSLNRHFAIGNFIGNCLRNEPIEIKGDGTPLRSYMYSSDLVEWLLTILHAGHSSGVYNVGSDEEISIRDLACQVKASTGVDVPVLIQKEPNSDALPVRYIPSVDKAKEELGLSCRCSLDEAVKKTFNWYQAQSRKI